MEFLNEFRLDSTLIKKHGIKSLTVYSNYAEDGLNESSNAVPNKLIGFSFNSEGQKKIIRSVPLHDNLIVLGDKGTKRAWFGYDTLHRIIYTREKNSSGDMEYTFTYNRANNTVKRGCPMMVKLPRRKHSIGRTAS